VCRGDCRQIRQAQHPFQQVSPNPVEFGRYSITSLDLTLFVWCSAAQQLQNEDILTLDSQQWLDTFQVNMHSYFFCSKAAIPHLKKEKGANIINNASIVSQQFCSSDVPTMSSPDSDDYVSTARADDLAPLYRTHSLEDRICWITRVPRDRSLPSLAVFQTKLSDPPESE